MYYSQSGGFKARDILGQVLTIPTCGTRTHTEVTVCDVLHILDTILVHCILHILGTILVHCLI